MVPNFIIFDCFRTLIYKKNLEVTIQRFIKRQLRCSIPLSYIQRSQHMMYERHKFNHPRFSRPQDRLHFYRDYNQEQLRLLGFAISDVAALELYTHCRALPYAVYADVIPTLRYLKKNAYNALAVLANWTETLASVLNQAGIAKYFEYVFSSHDLRATKPRGNIFEKFFKKVAPAERSKIYYIGDDYELDIVSARQASRSVEPILLDRNQLYPSMVDCKKIISLHDLKRYFK